MAEQQSAEEISDELLETQFHTTDDGFIRAKVVEIAGDDDEITVVAEAPSGERLSESFSKPTTWNSNERFVRFCEEYGYTAGTFNHMEGDRVRVHPDAPHPFVITGDGRFSKFKRGAAALVVVGLLSVLTLLGWVTFQAVQFGIGVVPI